MWRALSCFPLQGLRTAALACSARAPVSSTGPVAAAAKAASKQRAKAPVQKTATVKVRKSQLPCDLQSDLETKKYWANVLQQCERPMAVELRRHVDLTHPLGIRSLPAKSKGKGASGKRPSLPCFQEFKDYKGRYPTFLVLIRIGEFYEAAGVDAIVLVNYANLNAMSPASGVARAGMPIAKLQRTLDLLVKQLGFSVVVVEEEADYTYGHKRKHRKKRILGGIVTPASPNYVHGLVASGTDVRIDKPYPHVGVAMDAAGFMHMALDLDTMTIAVQEGLSEEALYASLSANSFAPPLFIHNSFYTPKATRESASTAQRKWQRRMRRLTRFEGVPSTKNYTEPNALHGFEQEARKALGLDATTPIAITKGVVRRPDVPQPPYMSTVMQLGMLQTPGLPNLLDSCLPPNAPLQSRAWMLRLLMLPPPAAVAASIREACALLSALEDVPVPDYTTLLTPTKIQLCVEKAQGTEVFYRELAPLLTAVLDTLQPAAEHAQLARFAELVLPAVERECGIALPADHVAEVCRRSINDIWSVVPRHGRSMLQAGKQQRREQGGNEQAPVKGYATDMGLYKAMKAASMGVEVLGKLAARLEKFHGRVLEHLIQQEVDQVSACKAEAFAALKEAYDPIIERCPGDKDHEKPRCHHDVANDAVWIGIPRSSTMSVTRAKGISVTSAKGIWSHLHHPKDRNGAVLEKTKAGMTILSTPRLDAALDAYRLATRAANSAATQQLQALAHRLGPNTAALAGACSLAVVATALVQHVAEAGTRRGWTLPAVGAPVVALENGNGEMGARGAPGASVGAPSAAAATPTAAGTAGVAVSGPVSFAVQGMWPFWLDGRDTSTVKNSFTLDSLVLLTGPNMAGKSTVLRSLCSVALLANCGLMVPAHSATVPFVDAFMLRNFSGDSPIDGKSSFAVEMDEMRYVLEDVTSQSLVLIDELGKGTEVFAGSVLSAAVIERLAAAGCRGVFATHLHLLHEMELRAPNVEMCRMEVVERPAHEIGELSELGLSLQRPTWRMVPGVCTESLALEVALKCKVPQSVIVRAAQLVKQVPSYASLAQRRTAAVEQLEQPQKAASAAAPGNAALAQQDLQLQPAAVQTAQTRAQPASEVSHTQQDVHLQPAAVQMPQQVPEASQAQHGMQLQQAPALARQPAVQMPQPAPEASQAQQHLQLQPPAAAAASHAKQELQSLIAAVQTPQPAPRPIRRRLHLPPLRVIAHATAVAPRLPKTAQQVPQSAQQVPPALQQAPAHGQPTSSAMRRPEQAPQPALSAAQAQSRVQPHALPPQQPAAASSSMPDAAHPGAHNAAAAPPAPIPATIVGTQGEYAALSAFRTPAAKLHQPATQPVQPAALAGSDDTHITAEAGSAAGLRQAEPPQVAAIPADQPLLRQAEQRQASLLQAEQQQTASLQADQQQAEQQQQQHAAPEAATSPAEQPQASSPEAEQQQQQQSRPASWPRGRKPAWASNREKPEHNHTIQDARAVLDEVVAASVQLASEPGSKTPSPRAQAAAQDPALLRTVLVTANFQPPPAHMHKACLYVVRWEDGWFYAGQTMKIRQRFSQHKRRAGKLGMAMEMTYVCLDDLEWAKEKMEPLIIRRLAERHFAMVSTNDARMR